MPLLSMQATILGFIPYFLYKESELLINNFIKLCPTTPIPQMINLKIIYCFYFNEFNKICFKFVILKKFKLLCCTIPPFQIQIDHIYYQQIVWNSPSTTTPSLIRRGEILMIGFDVIDNWW